MKIFRRLLFGYKANIREVSGNYWMSIDDLDFQGICFVSPNKKYAIGWKEDFDNWLYSYIVCRDNKIILKSSKIKGAVNYYCCDIANNGTFIFGETITSKKKIVDYTNKNKLYPEGSNFYAVTNDGKIIMEHFYFGATMAVAISENGQYAVLQTNFKEGLYFFDLLSRRLLWKKNPEIHVSRNGISIDLYQNRIWFDDYDYGRFSYDFNGEFIDRNKFLKEKLSKGKSADVISIIKEFIEKEGISENYLLPLKDALKRCKDPNEKANIHRFRGELFEGLGKFNDAVNEYELALGYNSKVGVKRKLEAIRKNLNKGKLSNKPESVSEVSKLADEYLKKMKKRGKK